MTNRLVREFCDVINPWGEVTGEDPDSIAFYAMAYLGAPWYVKAQGEVDDPRDPEHVGRSLEELAGRYTVRQLEGHRVNSSRILPRTACVAEGE